MDKTGVLTELPRIGRAVLEVGDDSVRELSLYSYRILLRGHRPGRVYPGRGAQAAGTEGGGYREVAETLSASPGCRMQ